MKLIIIRHGETEENLAGILQGHMPGTLSQKGIIQAQKLGQRLKQEQIDHIYCSDLKRAVDTAAEIIKFHPSTPTEYVKELRERNVGEFQGKPKSKYGWDNLHFITPKDGESFEQLQERLSQFLNKTLSKHPTDTVLYICHGGTGKALISIISNSAPSNHLKNASVSILEVHPEHNNQTILLNCTKHLTS